MRSAPARLLPHAPSTQPSPPTTCVEKQPTRKASAVPSDGSPSFPKIQPVANSRRISHHPKPAERREGKPATNASHLETSSPVSQQRSIGDIAQYHSFDLSTPHSPRSIPRCRAKNHLPGPLRLRSLRPSIYTRPRPSFSLRPVCDCLDFPQEFQKVHHALTRMLIGRPPLKATS